MALPDGMYSIAFELFDAPAAGTRHFSQTLNVELKDGLYNVLLSSNGPWDLPNAFGGPDRYMEISIVTSPGGIADGVVLSPRQQLASVPFAFASYGEQSTRVLLSTVDASPGTSEVVLSLPATDFDQFEITLVDVVPEADNSDLVARVSTDGGLTFHDQSADYYYHVSSLIRGQTKSASAATGDDEFLFNAVVVRHQLGNGPGQTFNSVSRVVNPGGTGPFTLRTQASFHGNDDAEVRPVVSDGTLVLSANTLRATTIQFRLKSGATYGDFQSGRFKLYGLR